MISVIMPCYCCANTVGRSIESVLAQTYTDFELIVVDDGSTDHSVEKLQALAADDARIKLMPTSNRGPGAARNRGLAEARGEYVAFLDADDYWAPEFLARMHSALSQSTADLAYCGWQNVGLEGGRGEPFIPPDYSETDLVETFLGGCRWPIHGALTRTQSLRSHGGFDEKWTSSMDYDLWLRLSVDIQIIRVPDVLAFYVHHGDTQITSNRARVLINHWRIQRRFIAKYPKVAQRIGKKRLRDIVHGDLMHRAFECYWKRNLECARPAFRQVMMHAYGRPKQWFYMLPSFLPLSIHRRLISLMERSQ